MIPIDWFNVASAVKGTEWDITNPQIVAQRDYQDIRMDGVEGGRAG